MERFYILLATLSLSTALAQPPSIRPVGGGHSGNFTLTKTIQTASGTEDAWDFDSCMENVMRQFTCKVDEQTYSVDLERQKIYWKTPEGKPTSRFGDKVLGIYTNVSGNTRFFVSCSNEVEFQTLTSSDPNIQYSSKRVECEAQTGVHAFVGNPSKYDIEDQIRRGETVSNFHVGDQVVTIKGYVGTIRGIRNETAPRTSSDFREIFMVGYQRKGVPEVIEPFRKSEIASTDPTSCDAGFCPEQKVITPDGYVGTVKGIRTDTTFLTSGDFRKIIMVEYTTNDDAAAVIEQFRRGELALIPTSW